MMKEIAKILVNDYAHRSEVVRGLIESGYGARVLKVKPDNKDRYSVDYVVVIYEEYDIEGSE